MGEHTKASRPNRLARETSPYLLLHAHNPVDWHPWGDEAFAAARASDRPIFLSIGYSTCYWCHVMEREVFSNEEIAAEMNLGFVNVKLDREERPDLDEVYMAATQLLTRSGGWPNSLFLTHELEPFFAGTYFPPRDQHGRPGFPRILRGVREAWALRRDGVLEQARAVAAAMAEQLSAEPVAARGEVGADTAAGALQALKQRFDRDAGGFGGAPKFPSPSNLFFLLEEAQRGDGDAREMLVVTLDHMARGGIHDQIGGGFHRYSTDAEWLVPHFEKMLYDNAALATLYAEAATLAPEDGFARVARATLDFVLAELTGSDGGFLSAIDAETDGHEGAYYTWTRDELRAILGASDFNRLADVYGFGGRPNFEDDRYVLHLPEPLGAKARALGSTEPELLQQLAPGRRAILDARWQRKRPLVDDKVLVDWNGLMIGAMATVGARLPEPRYLDAARAAAEFVLGRMRFESGELGHVFRLGLSPIPALLDDYAFLIEGLLALHAGTGEERWLREAERLQDEQDRRLWDEVEGGYFAAGEDAHSILRAKPSYDGAVASGNGIAALNLIALAGRTGVDAREARARRTLAAFGGGIERHPLAHMTLVRAAQRLALQPGASRPSVAAAVPELAATARAVVEARGRVDTAVAGEWKPFALDLAIRSGWHINANPASEPMLIATEVSGPVRALRYPSSDSLQPAFAAAAISVYGGFVTIEGEVKTEPGIDPRVVLTYQPCDETRCLPQLAIEVMLRPRPDRPAA